MKKIIVSILAIAVTMAVTPSVEAQDYSAGAVVTQLFTVPAGTNTAGATYSATLTNTRNNRTIVPESFFQRIGTATGEASTNTVTIFYTPNGSATSYRVGTIAAQTYGAEAAAALANLPMLKQGDALEFQGTAWSNLTFGVTYGLVPNR